MINIFKDDIKLEKILNREIQSFGNLENTVDEIIENVIKNGDKAVLEYSRKFDCPDLNTMEVSKEEIENGYNNTSEELLQILREAKSNIELFHKKQLKDGFRIEKENGIILGQKYTPIEKVGIYVPGGTAAYPSTVLMNAIPAKIAGVSQIIMVTPCGKDGKIKNEILAAAKICGVDRIFKCGGAQAIAALAYGTESIPNVYKIVGPGNIYVALAKKAVFGKVSIDMIAGPSEILIIADKSANPNYVAADLLSQAEHDKLATAVLVTDSEELAKQTSTVLEERIKKLPRCDIARESIDTNGKIIIVDNIDKAIEISNSIAPEHLELCVNDPFSILDKITNAGSIFMGHNTPEAIGDYFAGPNHTLPTGGSAKFSSPLSVDDFVKKSAYSFYPEKATLDAMDKISKFAKVEGLDAHAESVLTRGGKA
ncbi:MAG: histidinol dehydrogenase [Ruminococcaceae bacterium]|nr:histidinol dehydrogenase [Oscillospiraceae bacterium]